MAINRNTISWDDWMDAVKAEFERVFGCSFEDAKYDADAFREMYDDGLTSSKAVSEEAAAAAASS